LSGFVLRDDQETEKFPSSSLLSDLILLNVMKISKSRIDGLEEFQGREIQVHFSRAKGVTG
jgi:hypothetical protein